jgi:hypothetical protein
MLPMYVEDELALQPVRERYPVIWKHLRTCAECAGAYADLRSMLRAEREGRMVAPPIRPNSRLPFLQPAQPARRAEWTIQEQLAQPGGLVALITISKAFIGRLLAPHPAIGWARAGTTGPGQPRQPLLDGLLEERGWLVSVEVIREQDRDTSQHLLVTIVGADTPERLEAQVVAEGGDKRTLRLNQRGEALFREVPTAWLTPESNDATAEDLRITIRQVEL